jgi:hypothetical protein
MFGIQLSKTRILLYSLIGFAYFASIFHRLQVDGFLFMNSPFAIKVLLLSLYVIQPPIQLVPGGEADHSLPPSVKVKNAWHYTSIPQYVFMA